MRCLQTHSGKQVALLEPKVCQPEANANYYMRLIQH